MIILSYPTEGFIKPITIMINYPNNKIVALCYKYLITRPFDFPLFSSEIEKILDNYPQELYKIDKKDEQKDILSKILFLRDDFGQNKRKMLMLIIDRGSHISKNNGKLFIEKSTLLRDLVFYYYDMNIEGGAFETMHVSIGMMIKHIIDKGLDLNHVHKHSITGDTSLMILFKYGKLTSNIFVYKTMHKLISRIIDQHLHRINVDIQNKNGDTVLTYLLKYPPADKKMFTTFKILIEKSEKPLIIYDSDVHCFAMLSVVNFPRHLTGDVSEKDYPNSRRDVIKCPRSLTMKGVTKLGSGIGFIISDAMKIAEYLYDKYPFFDNKLERVLEMQLANSIQFDDKYASSSNGYRDIAVKSRTELKNKLTVELKNVLDKNRERRAIVLVELYRKKYEQFKTSVYW